MISSTISRAKVAEWAARAKVEPEGLSKRRMQQIVRNWTTLVAAAVAEELRTRTLSSKR
jgi:hypothetical protein